MTGHISEPDEIPPQSGSSLPQEPVETPRLSNDPDPDPEADVLREPAPGRGEPEKDPDPDPQA